MLEPIMARVALLLMQLLAVIVIWQLVFAMVTAAIK